MQVAKGQGSKERVHGVRVRVGVGMEVHGCCARAARVQGSLDDVFL